MVLLIHREINEVNIDGAVDLVLTPQFYTLRKEDLPVKYAYQAKKIAPSLFEGLVEENGEYEYFVYKEGEEWVFIAYDPSELIAFLRSKGIPPEKVRHVFFAQQIISQLGSPVSLGENSVLAPIRQTATIVPSAVAAESSPFDPERITLPKKSVRLNVGATSLVPPRYMWMFAGVFLLFGMLWLIEGVRYNKDNGMLEAKLQKIYEAYPSLQNSYTRENIAKKYHALDKSERKKRQVVSQISKVLVKGVTLDEFEMDKKKFKAVLSTSGADVSKRLETLLKQNGMKKSSASSGNRFVIEGSL